MASPVLVTGGTGRRGKLVVARLQDSGCDVGNARPARPAHPARRDILHRRPADQPGHRAGRDSSGGHHPLRNQHQGDAEATRNLVAAASRTGPAHLVYVSIVAIDRLASKGYPKTKLRAEQIVANPGLPWTIL